MAMNLVVIEGMNEACSRKFRRSIHGLAALHAKSCGDDVASKATYCRNCSRKACNVSVMVDDGLAELMAARATPWAGSCYRSGRDDAFSFPVFRRQMRLLVGAPRTQEPGPLRFSSLAQISQPARS